MKQIRVKTRFNIKTLNGTIEYGPGQIVDETIANQFPEFVKITERAEVVDQAQSIVEETKEVIEEPVVEEEVVEKPKAKPKRRKSKRR